MKRVLLAALLLLPTLALGQTYNQFKPANGVLKGQTTTFVTTAAASPDIISMWSGSCDLTHFLRGDGTCATVGSLTSLTQGTGITLTPNPITTTGSVAIDTSVVPRLGVTNTFTASQELDLTVNDLLRVGITNASGGAAASAQYVAFNGTNAISMGMTGPSFSGTVWGSGPSGQQGFLGSEGNFPLSIATNEISRLTIEGDGSWNINGSNGSSGQVITSAGGASTPTWTTVAGGVTGLANPTGTIGLVAVNGSASTALRSDGAPPLSQAIVPTWTGIHTHSLAQPIVVYSATGAGVNEKNTLLREAANGTFAISSATDAAPTTVVSNVLAAGRVGSGSAWNALTFGNATDNPIYTFSGSGNVITNSAISTGGVTPSRIGSITIADATLPQLFLDVTGQGADGKFWNIFGSGATISFAAESDSHATDRNYLSVARSGNAISSLSFGNATDNPTYNFLGTGATTFGGDGNASRSASGGTVLLSSTNTSNTASSIARVTASVAGASAGDPDFRLNISGVNDWFLRAENATSDQFSLIANSTKALTCQTTGSCDFPVAATVAGVSICRSDGTNCPAVGSSTTRVKTALTSRASTTTVSCDPDLTISNLTNGKMYRIQALLNFDGNGITANGWRVSTTGTNVTNQIDQQIANTNTTTANTAPVASSQADVGGEFNAAFTAAGRLGVVSMDWTLLTTSGTNTVCVSWAQSASNATGTDLNAGSSMVITLLN